MDPALFRIDWEVLFSSHRQCSNCVRRYNSQTRNCGSLRSTSTANNYDLPLF